MARYTYTISFQAELSAKNESQAEQRLNEMLDLLGQVKTPNAYWDSIDYDLIDEEMGE
jgi:hypothetical protein